MLRKGSCRMWCVLHVDDGKEIRAERLIDGLLGGKCCSRCFHLTRVRRKKYGGKWQTVREDLLPGYVFIATEEPVQVYEGLKRVPGHELLGGSGGHVAALGSQEAGFMEKLVGNGSRAGEIALSRIRVSGDGQVKVLSGPLLLLQGQVRRIDLHRRVAEVEAEFMGKKKLLYLGVEFEGAM